MIKFGSDAKLQLRITTQADAATDVIISGITRSEQFNHKHRTVATGAQTTEDFGISDMPIMVSVSAASDAIIQGRIVVRLSFIINGQLIQELTSGNVYTGKSLSWPFTNQQDLRPGGGVLETITTSNPSAGNEHTTTIPDTEIWIILQATVSLTTDANAATRSVQLNIRTTSTNQVEYPPGTTQIESLTRNYRIAPLGTNNASLVEDNIFINIPARMPLFAGTQINTSTVNKQAGDDFSSMKIYVEKFFAPDVT